MKLDQDLLERFEKTINTSHPDKGNISIKILGYGEISLVFQLENNDEMAFKRLPIFNSEKQVKRHIKAYELYQRDLLEKIGLHIPPFGSAYVKTKKNSYTLFLAQQKLNSSSLCHKIIHSVSQDQIELIYHLIMKELLKIFTFNKKNISKKVGIDAQISNWAIKNFDPEHIQVTEQTKFYYIDTSTPMFRIDGNEAMEAELFLESAPFFLRGILKLLFLQEVLDRYYDWRLVAIDMLANLYKEQKQNSIPGCLKIVNDFFSTEAKEFGIKKIHLQEVTDYYSSDKLIWEIFQSARRFDKFLQTKLLKGKYAFYLPPVIKR